MLQNAGTPEPPSDAVGLRYHAQDDTTYCGAAVAQMILRQFEPALEDQDILARKNAHNNPPGQPNGVSAEGLARTLNEYVRGAFASMRPLDPLAAAVAELLHTRRGVAALVHGGTHWVALNGVVSGDPASAGFYVHDPHARILPDRHSDQDLCGSGNGHGFANQFFTFAGMRRFCYPVALVSTPTPQAAAPPAPPRLALAARPAAPGPRAIDPLAAAASAIAATGIAERGPLSESLAGFRPAAHVPLGDDHHVTLRRDARVVGYALLAREGTLLAVMASGNESPLPDPAEGAVRSELERNRKQLERVHPEFLRALDAGQDAVRASFTWQRCREAPSPAHPLLRIDVGPNVLYRDHAGACHAQLHLLP